MTATADKSVDTVEACSVQSPDRKLTCDLQHGHPGSHAANAAPGVAWYKRRYIENLEPQGGDAPTDAEAPADSKPTAEVKRLQKVWMDVVGAAVGALSVPVEIADGVLVIEVPTAEVSQEFSFIEGLILDATAQMNLRIERLVIRVIGTDASEAKTIETTVDGKTSKVVLDGTTGEPIAEAEAHQPRLIDADLRAIELQLARVNADLIEAAAEKKDAADRFKEAQNRQNAVVAELVRCINGEQKLPFDEPAAAHALETASKVAKAAAEAAAVDPEDDEPELPLGGANPEEEAIQRVRGVRRASDGEIDTGKEPGETDLSGPEN